MSAAPKSEDKDTDELDPGSLSLIRDEAKCHSYYPAAQERTRMLALKNKRAAPKPEDKDIDELDAETLMLVINFGLLPGASDADKKIGKQARARLDELQPWGPLDLKNVTLIDIVGRSDADRAKEAFEKAQKKADGGSRGVEAEQQSKPPARRFVCRVNVEDES